MERRRFLGLGVGIVGATGALAPARPGETTGWAEDGFESFRPRNRSVDRAYEFLTFAMDAYQQGPTLRLIQSYSDNLALGSTAFVSDNAVAIIAYLQRRRRDDVARAMLLGDSFLYAQTHDETYADGRVRQAYWVGPFTLPHTSTDSYFVRANGSVNLVGAPWEPRKF